MTTKRTMKPSIWTKRSSMTLLLGYPEIRWNLSTPMALLPSWSRLFDYDGAVYASCGTENLHQESLSGSGRLALRNPSTLTTMIYLLPMKTSPKSSALWSGISSTRGLNMLFDYSREPHSDIAFVGYEKFLCQLWMCPSRAQPLDDFSLRHESERQFCWPDFGELSRFQTSLRQEKCQP